MSVLNDLVNQIEDVALRERIAKEVDRLSKQKKFGLVFEEHLPECTPLYEIPVKVGALVAKKTGQVNDVYKILSITDGNAECLHRDSKEIVKIAVAELVTVAEFGEPIYPYLKPLDSVCNAPDSDLWHTLIEADNYHALQLLEYLYAGKVDCIYIDPPYNTGARDWKYNNDYVDSTDAYRHSKWLSFMQKRLKMAKRLLNPKDSVLIVTIDEKEYLHLGCLLEEVFASERMQMISSVINPAGSARKGLFARSDEYIFIVYFGDATPFPLPLHDEWLGGVKNTSKKSLHWNSLARTGTNSHRPDLPTMFFPIYVAEDGSRIVKVGESTPADMDRNDVEKIDGTITIWPIHTDGSEGTWQQSPETLRKIIEKGYVKLGRFTDRGMAISYLKRGEQAKVEKGLFPIVGSRDDGSIIVDDGDYIPTFVPSTQWNISSHDASRFGSNLLRSLLPDRKFPYPKSLYAVHDILKFFTSEKPDALVVDFFSGSGTTLHAINLINSQDNGNRRCIMVTNNEVSVDEASELSRQGFQPGDPEWEKFGIARYITWPRTRCSVLGCDIKGAPLKGNYIGSEKAMSDGFKSNVAFYKLGFLDRNSVALGRQFKEMLPTLWMKAGAIGPCPALETDTLPEMLVLPENKFAVLLDERYYLDFVMKLDEHPEIKTVYIVTDSEAGYRDMIAGMEDKDTYQLYRDYLDNFRINSVRR